MNTRPAVVGVLPLLSLVACVSDLSPDPYKKWGVDQSNAEASADAETPDAQGGRDASSHASADAKADSAPPSTDQRVVDAGAPKDEVPSEPVGCDLTGRWIMTERNFSSSFGAKQVNLGWFYVELKQEGDVVSTVKSMLCGARSEGLGFVVYTDDRPAWPAYQMFSGYAGRKGTSKEAGAGCEVAFEEGALIRGMTPSVYSEKSVPLPTLEQKANGSTPGWEDWDDDGKPGVTLIVTGAAQGKVYQAFRTFSTDTGTIDVAASTFKLDHEWVQERQVLGYDPPTAFLFSSPAERAPDPGANLVEFTRLAADQATGDDDAKCQAIRELAPSLTPNANKIK